MTLWYLAEYVEPVQREKLSVAFCSNSTKSYRIDSCNNSNSYLTDTSTFEKQGISAARCGLEEEGGLTDVKAQSEI